MDKNNVDEFLGDLKPGASEDVFDTTQDDVFGEAVDATTEDEGTTEEKEEKIPLHKDPKVQRYIEKQIEKRLAEHKPTETEKFIASTTTDEIDEVLTRIIGNDTPEKLAAVRDFKKVLLEREERGAAKALETIKTEQQATLEAERKAEETLLQGFDDIEETYNVDLTSKTPTAKKMRAEFINFIKRVAPKDAHGDIVEYPDFQETFKLFQEVKKTAEPSQKAKELASRSMERGGDATQEAQPQDKSWRAVDRIFSKLTG